MNITDVLTFVASKMTDYEPDWTHIRFALAVGQNSSLLACREMSKITLFPFSICSYLFEQHGRGLWQNPDHVVGREMLRQLAHEFRHEQQETLWDTDIPQVDAAHKTNEALGVDGAADFDAYWNDPGEKDAREFAERVVAAAPEEVIVFLEALARDFIKAHVSEVKRDAAR